MKEITSGSVLRGVREDVELHTADGLTLVGELTIPLGRTPRVTLVTLHPLPTAGGYMDSHVLRKAAWRLPELADIAVLRFNTRGTSSPRGTSDGVFGEGITEKFDVQAAMDFVHERGLPNPWLLGWSFGTELTLKYGLDHDISGAILLSPPLHRATAAEVERWADSPVPLHALIPEFDDYLQPAAAAERFASVPTAEVLGIDGAKHLWVGEKQVRRVLDEIVRITVGQGPLPVEVSADRFTA